MEITLRITGGTRGVGCVGGPLSAEKSASSVKADGLRFISLDGTW